VYKRFFSSVQIDVFLRGGGRGEYKINKDAGWVRVCSRSTLILNPKIHFSAFIEGTLIRDLYTQRLVQSTRPS